MSFLFVLSSKFKLDGRKKTKRNKEAWLPYIHKLNLGSTIAIMSPLIHYYVVPNQISCSKTNKFHLWKKMLWIFLPYMKVKEVIWCNFKFSFLFGVLQAVGT